jgi:hypothetical protein
MPLAVLLAFDEVENSYQFPFMLLLTLILAGGALAYMLSNRTWQRVLALLVSTTWAVAVDRSGEWDLLARTPGFLDETTGKWV